MKQVTQAAITALLTHFFSNRPVNTLIRKAYLNGVRLDGPIEIYKNMVSFFFTEKGENTGYLRVHQGCLSPDIMMLLGRDEQGEHEFTFEFLGKPIQVFVTLDSGLWYTISCRHLDDIIATAEERAND